MNTLVLALGLPVFVVLNAIGWRVVFVYQRRIIRRQEGEYRALAAVHFECPGPGQSARLSTASHAERSEVTSLLTHRKLRRPAPSDEPRSP